MVKRKAKISKTAASNIASIAWFIESKGMVSTAERFIENVFAFIDNLCKKNVSYALCRDKKRAAHGYKCVTYKRKYTIVFLEFENELIFKEIIASKNIH